MPVHNEAKYLTAALDSLLAQDFQDFELLISDNASQDATQEICLTYGARDARIRYARREANAGAVENFNAVFHAARGKYFMWAAGHDLWQSSYISRCLDSFTGDPGLVLCASQVNVIGPQNEILEIVSDGLETRGLPAFERSRAVLRGLVRLPYSDPIYGLIRADALHRTGLSRNVWGTDNLILLELSVMGSFALIPEPLYSRRAHPERRGEAETWTERYLEALSPKNRGRRWSLSYSQMACGYMGVVQRAPFPFTQKLRLFATIWRSVLGRFWRGWLFHDVVCGVLRLLLGPRALSHFKKHAYRVARAVGAYR